MRETSFFIEGTHAQGDRVSLVPGDARKLLSVLRAKSGDTVELVDSTSQRFSATIEVEGPSVVATLDALL
ncbi:MAG: hypothetical protein ACYDA1_03425, partial [Vulcanimicrobiaceae bacterium]